MFDGRVKKSRFLRVELDAENIGKPFMFNRFYDFSIHRGRSNLPAFSQHFQVFNQLYKQGVMLEGMILKPNMVLPGLTCPVQNSLAEVADATMKCLLRTVPAAVPGIAFLSGGQSAELASARLNAMNVRFKSKLPWELSFSFARAIQQPAMEIWQGKEANVSKAQQALYHRAKCNFEARRGEYKNQ